MANMYTYPEPGVILADIDKIMCDPEHSDDHVKIRFSSREQLKSEITISTKEAQYLIDSLQAVLDSAARKDYHPYVMTVDNEE